MSDSKAEWCDQCYDYHICSGSHLSTVPGSVDDLVTMLVKAREYVNAYVENRDVPSGVTGGLSLIEDIDAVVMHYTNTKARNVP